MASVTRSPSESANEFLNSLRDFSTVVTDWEKERDGWFMFRGIDDIEHKLIPAALRTKEMHEKKFDQLWGIASCRFEDVQPGNVTYQVRAELEVVRRFYRLILMGCRCRP